MLPWQAGMLPEATFRGVPFHVDDRTRSSGRRGEDNEFPDRDPPEGQDLGRKLRTFKVTGYVIGDDYMRSRDRLLLALEQRGPGPYRDPWGGSWTVNVRGYDCKESVAAGGIARFDVDFKEHGEQRFPNAALDTLAAVLGAADGLSSAARASFDARFRVVGQPDAVTADAARQVRALAARLTALRQSVPLLGIDGLPSPGMAVTGFLRDLDGNLTGGLGDALAGLFQDVAGAVYDRSPHGTVLGSPASAGAAFAALSTQSAGTGWLAPGTSWGGQTALNRQALAGLARQLAAVEESRAAAVTSFDSREAALAARDALDGRLAALQTTAGGGAGTGFDDALFAAVAVLRQAVGADLTARAGALPRIRYVDTRTPLPAFVLAHREFGDASRAFDLLTRNPGVLHPGFVPAGRRLETLDGT